MHMKKFILLSVSLFAVMVAFSQVTLTYTNNALILGDSIAAKEIQYVSPAMPVQTKCGIFLKFSLQEQVR